MAIYYIYYMDILRNGFQWRIAQVKANNKKMALNKLSYYRDIVKSHCIITKSGADNKIIDLII